MSVVKVAMANANVVIVTRIHKTFGFFVFTFVRRTTFAIVPADLRSAGKKYKKQSSALANFQSANFLFHIISQFYANVCNWIFRFSLFIFRLNNHYVCICFVQV